MENTTKDLRAQIEALNEEAREQFRDPAYRRGASEDIAAAVYEGFVNENIVDIFTETEYLPYGGRSHIKETTGLKAFSIARGGYIEESSLTSDVMELPRDQIGFHIREFEDKIAENFVESAQTLRTLGKMRINAEVNQRVLGVHQAAVNASSPYYVASAGLTLAQVNDAVEAVQDATESLENPTIIGRASMTRKIEDGLSSNNTYSSFLPETNENLAIRGVLGQYRGANIVTLKNHKDGSGNSYFPANELWIIGKDAGKTAFYGGPKTKDFLEDDNWYWHYLYRMDYGTAVVRPDRIRRIVDSSVAA